MGIIIFLAIKWAAFNDMFTIKNVEINGVQYFDDSSLASYKSEIKDNHIMFLDLQSHKDRIESLIYVKDCKISRTFPETINIVIYEREPLVMINSTDLIMLDVDGICLPVEEYDAISLPILSNFKTNEELYPTGQKTKSSNVARSIDIIKYSKRNFNRLYEDISEFVFNDSNEYEIILKNGKTKILLGSNNILKKIDYLKAFDSALPADKNFNIYKYIDLRYKDQIVVKERRV
ncbi:MAG: FtsQ-type POTRA domain-containing protein [Candidatus Neomarinimicrobiota bacterium]|nr:FtsQ-type POTRA domain-containing protein [Candidatus Neomarinimicrobiota bacterium]